MADDGVTAELERIRAAAAAAAGSAVTTTQRRVLDRYVPSLVAAVIREARKQAALSRPRLAAVVGVSASAVQWWEEGNGIPNEEHWVQLELALGPLGIVRDPGPGREAATERSDAA